MRYLGGKADRAPLIAAYLNRQRRPGQVYWEPFVGAASVASRIGPGLNLFSDIHRELVALLSAVACGWDPPDRVTLEEYERLRDGAGQARLRAFVGFGCSWGGRYWGGYARDNGRNFAAEARASLKRKMATIQDPIFFVADFLRSPLPVTAAPMLIFCDPPYIGRTAYKGTPPFDHDLFWGQVRTLSEAGHNVIVAEYEAPLDFSPLAKIPRGRPVQSWAPGAFSLFRYDPAGRMAPIQPALLEV